MSKPARFEEREPAEREGRWESGGRYSNNLSRQVQKTIEVGSIFQVASRRKKKKNFKSYRES